MRKIIFAAAVLLLSASIFGCGLFGAERTLFDEKVDGERKGYEGGSMQYVSNTESSLTVRITNDSASTWQSGNMRDYKLEAQYEGEWYEVVQIGELANTMELMIFAPGDELVHTFYFNERYGKMTPGKYRVVKSYWANATDTDEAGEFYLICEFSIS